MDEVIVTAKAAFAIWLILEGESKPLESVRFEDQATCQSILDHDINGRGSEWRYSDNSVQHRKILKAYCDRATPGPEENEK